MANQPPGMRFIRKHLQNNQYRLTKHATVVRLQRGISMLELKRALADGEIIERNPDDDKWESDYKTRKVKK